MKRADCDIITVEEWKCPEDNGVALLTMPNIPYPLHLMAPRTILGNTAWNFMRNHCYKEANDTCEVCGYHPEDLRGRHAHELYDIDYANQTATFKRCVCLCRYCHILGIHTGRALTMFKKSNPMFTADKLLEGAEHVFKLVSEYNKKHPKKKPLRLFSAWTDYLKQPELNPKMSELIQKYDIKFYRVSDKWYKKKYWKNWKLIIGNKEYHTPYEDLVDWSNAMEENNKAQYGSKKGRGENPFKGKVFDEMDEILKK